MYPEQCKIYIGDAPEFSDQSFVPKMRARVGERAVPRAQNTIARKMAAFLKQTIHIPLQIKLRMAGFPKPTFPIQILNSWISK